LENRHDASKEDHQNDHEDEEPFEAVDHLDHHHVQRAERPEDTQHFHRAVQREADQQHQVDFALEGVGGVVLLLDVVDDVYDDVADVVQILKVHEIFQNAHLRELYGLIDDGLKSEKQKEDMVTRGGVPSLVIGIVDWQLETSLDVNIIGVPNQVEDKQSVDQSAGLMMPLAETCPFVLNEIVDVLVVEDFEFV